MDKIIEKEFQTLLNEIDSGLSRKQKTLPSKLFYDEKGSLLFDEICKLKEYYPTRTELMIMKSNINEISDMFGENSLFIEFGSGSSLKTRLLLSNIKKISGYIPVDISEEHLLKTAAALTERYPDLKIYPVAADYTKSIKFPSINTEVKNTVAFFPGSTIGNFTTEEAKEFLGVIAEEVGKKGALLIGVDLVKDRTVLFDAYNDSKGVTADFNLNLLTRLNSEFGFNFNIDEFEHNAPFNEEKSRIEMHLISKKNQTVKGANGKTYSFSKGEIIVTEYSHKYTLESFADMASKYFEVNKVWTDERSYFSVQYLSVK